VVLAEVSQLEEFTRYVEFLQLLFWREVEDRAVPPALRQVVRDGRDRVVPKWVQPRVPQQHVILAVLSHHVQELFIFLEIGHLLLEVVDGTIEVTGAVREHVEPLIAAGLII